MPRDYKKEHKNYQGKPDQIKKRASRNAARAKVAKTGADIKGKDIDHKNGNPKDNRASNLKPKSPSTNRSFPRTPKARKK